MPRPEWVVFRGRAVCQKAGPALIVHPARLRPNGETVALELSGSHSELAAVALERAAQPTRLDGLVRSVAEQCAEDLMLVEDLVASLLEHGILVPVVPASQRVRVDGEGAAVDALRAHIGLAFWPVELPGATLYVLGTLGSLGWRDRLRIASDSQGCAVTVSLDGTGAWIGPLVGQAGGPCPGCLAARRFAVAPTVHAFDTVVVHSPRALSAMCVHAFLHAQLSVTGERPADRVLYVDDEGATLHTLLRQPGCLHCANPASSSLATQSDSDAISSRFRSDWAIDDGIEPSEAQKEAFEDSLLGPLEIQDFQVPGLFRELPMVLGSIRLLQRRGDKFERRELFSVTFGSGMTESRRRLVAFSEGIERYALTIDSPDIRSKRYSEIGDVAFPPQETVRFAPEQYEIEPAAPRYEDQPVDWSWVYDWMSDRPRLLVHDAISYDHDRPAAAFRLVEDPFSSGAAAHRSLPRAVCRTLLELIERDAFMLTWYLRLPLREIDVRCVRDAEVQELRGYLTEHAIDLRFFDMRVDFDLPSVLVLARARADCGQWRAKGHIVAASTALTWRAALGHALHEILGHYSTFALVSPDGNAALDPATGGMRTWWPAFAEYFLPRNDDPWAFLGRDSMTTVSDGSGDDVPLRGWLEELRNQFRARDLPVLVRYLAPDAVEGSGLTAVRACVPGLIRMTPNRRTVNFGEPRMRIIGDRWGHDGPLNPLVHPIG